MSENQKQSVEGVLNLICNVRAGSMDEKQFRATIELNISHLLSQQQLEVVEKAKRIVENEMAHGCDETLGECLHCRIIDILLQSLSTLNINK